MEEREPKKGAGRPAGSYQLRRFRDTNLGRFIYLHEPLLYKVICPREQDGYSPEIFLIETVIGCSNNPSFQTERFKKYLEEFKERGLHVPRVRKILKENKEHYRNLRFIRALSYIRENRQEIEARDRLAMELIKMKIEQQEGRV